MTAIYKYQRITTPGPDGATLYFRNAEDEPRALELGELYGWHYVSVPEAALLPEQPTEIDWQIVTLDAELRASLLATCRPLQLIAEAVVERIRSRYSLDDELFLNRIATGVANGLYEYQDGEEAEVIAFGVWAEECRQWGRARRAELGL